MGMDFILSHTSISYNHTASATFTRSLALADMQFEEPFPEVFVIRSPYTSIASLQSFHFTKEKVRRELDVLLACRVYDSR